MPRLFQKIVYIIIILSAFSCISQNEKSERINVAVTIPPYHYLVKKIGGDKIEVHTSIPVGVTPHHFEPTPKSIQEISSCNYYLAVGGGIEFEDVWLSKLKGINKELSVYDLSKNIEYINDDPHVWLSPKRIKTISKNIYNALIKISPDDTTYFSNNYKSLVDSIDQILSELNASFRKIENKKLLVYHGSWTYFADDFGFKQISIEQGSKSASAKEYKDILDEVRESEIPVIFVDPQHSKAPAEVIAKDLLVPIDTINPIPTNLLSNFLKVKTKIENHYK